jgi:hypothetical protein
MRFPRSKVLLAFAVGLPLAAQPPGPPRGGAANPKAAAPIDLTGYWVSVVSEDWRYRMVTPAPGDYQGVPMTAAARKVADAWDPSKDEASGDQCKSYGAPALLRIPGHLHITWQDDRTLKIETDAGTQTRVLAFGEAKPASGPPTLQGDSQASWEIQRPSGPGAKPGGSLKVTTNHLKAGYLRKNGVPYSENAVLTEYYDVLHERNGDQMMVVTTVVADPMYLREPFIITTHFKKQNNDSGWKPSACSAKW